MRKEIGKHWGTDLCPDREAIIFFNVDEAYWEVEFWDNNKLIENRPMVTDGVVHSERYAEDAAENWCLGYIP